MFRRRSSSLLARSASFLCRLVSRPNNLVCFSDVGLFTAADGAFVCLFVVGLFTSDVVVAGVVGVVVVVTAVVGFPTSTLSVGLGTSGI